MEQRLQTIVDQLNEYAEQYYRYAVSYTHLTLPTN